MSASIVIADDHPLILKGLQDFLLEKKFDVVASAKNGREAFNYIKSLEPDIAILDIQMPIFTGLEVAEKCQDEGFATKLVIITLEKSAEFYHEAKSIGVHGYVLKEFALEEIEKCIEDVLKGKDYFSPDLSEVLEEHKMPEEMKTLTETELKVLRLIAARKTAKEISEILNNSDRTVEKHKSHIRQKLKLDSDTNSLLLYAKKYEGYLNSSNFPFK